LPQLKRDWTGRGNRDAARAARALENHFRGVGGTQLPLLAGKYVFGDLFGPEAGNGRLFFTNLQIGVIGEFQIEQNPLVGSFLKGISGTILVNFIC
jgi:hypothetical protein